MEKVVMIFKATFYSTYASCSTIFPLMVSGQAPKTKLPFFGELPAVIHSFVVELLAEPHTMIKTLTERTGRPHFSYSIPDYSSMEIPHLTKIWLLWCSWRSNVFESLRFNPVGHFCRFKSESDLVFKSVSETVTDFSLAAIILQLPIRQLLYHYEEFHPQALRLFLPPVA